MIANIGLWFSGAYALFVLWTAWDVAYARGRFSRGSI
jgi:hypothetical protein